MEKSAKTLKLSHSFFPVTGEVLPASANDADGARSDVSAIGLSNPMNRAFIDLVVFNPHALSNAAKNLEQMYVRHERDKKRDYLQRILQVKKGNFQSSRVQL